MTTQTIDLQSFCDAEPNKRFAMQQPWNKGGFRYATDARIAVAVPSNEPETVAERRLVNVESVFDGMANVTDWQPVAFTVPNCDECDGSGSIKRDKCQRCKGRGVVDHYCGCELCEADEEECPDCGGEDGPFFATCTKCCTDNTVDILGVNVAYKYARKLLTLPGIEYSKRNETTLFFRFADGGRGAVCGISKGQW